MSGIYLAIPPRGAYPLSRISSLFYRGELKDCLTRAFKVSTYQVGSRSFPEGRVLRDYARGVLPGSSRQTHILELYPVKLL